MGFPQELLQKSNKGWDLESWKIGPGCLQEDTGWPSAVRNLFIKHMLCSRHRGCSAEHPYSWLQGEDGIQGYQFVSGTWMEWLRTFKVRLHLNLPLKLSCAPIPSHLTSISACWVWETWNNINWPQRKIKNLGKGAGVFKGNKCEFGERISDLHPKLWTVEELAEFYQLPTREERISKTDGILGPSQEDDSNIEGWRKNLGKKWKSFEYFIKVDMKWGCEMV